MATTWSDSEATLALLDAASQGDRGAVEALFARHLPAVKWSVRRRMRRQVLPRFDPSDVMQETHCSARRQLPNYLTRRPMPFRLWLWKTAHQRLIDDERAHMRARRNVAREVPLTDASSYIMASTLRGNSCSSPSQIAQRREQAQCVRQCLAMLQEIDREILFLRIFDGMNNAEVSALLELAPDAAKKRFTRALLRLKIQLRQAGFP